MRRIARALGVGWISAVLAASVSVGDEPLTNERIVRDFLDGATTEELIERIRLDEVAFDASPEMLEEMKRAGVPAPVLEAMKRRVDELTAPPRIEAGPTRTLTIALNPGLHKTKQRRIRISDQLPLDIKYLWSLSMGTDDRRFTDVAIFLACSESHHIPDHWRSKTPFGGDSGAMPRHRILVFEDGAAWGRSSFLAGAKIERNEDGSPARRGPAPDDPPGVLELSIPEEIRVELAANEVHELHMGIAIRAGKHFYPWTMSTLSEVEVGDGLLEMEVAIVGAGLNKLELAFSEQEQRKYSARPTCARGCAID